MDKIIAPNPAVNGKITMELNGIPTTDFSLQMTDHLGRVRWVQYWPAGPQPKSIPMTLDDSFANGIYYLCLRTATGQSIVKRFVLMR